MLLLCLIHYCLLQMILSTVPLEVLTIHLQVLDNKLLVDRSANYGQTPSYEFSLEELHPFLKGDCLVVV